MLLLAGLSLCLPRLHMAVGNALVIEPIVAALYAAAAAWLLPRRERGLLAGDLQSGLIVCFVVWTCVAGLRGGAQGAYGTLTSTGAEVATLLAVFAFVALLLGTAQSRAQTEERLIAIAASPVIYCLANLVLHAGGVGSSGEQLGLATGSAGTLLAPFGFATTRESLPLSGAGVNTMGIVAGAGMVGAFLLGRSRAVGRGIAMLGFCVSFYCLVLSDTRTALLLGLAVGLVYAFRPATSLRWAAVAVVVMPLVAQMVFGTALAGLGEAFARSAQDLGTANGRVYVWDGVRSFLSDGSLQQLVGWGAGGQITSGASMRYAYFFRSQLSPTSYSAHNLTYQTILDAGYVGLLLLAASVWTAGSVLSRLAAHGSAAAPALLAIVGVLVAAGITESSPGYGQETMLLLIVVLGAAVGILIRDRPCGTAARPVPGAARLQGAARKRHMGPPAMVEDRSVADGAVWSL